MSVEKPPENYGKICAPWWDEVWIVAGGRSARRFDLMNLYNKTVFAVNDAVFKFGQGTSVYSYPASSVTVFSLDNNWIRRHRDFLEDFQGPKYFALPLETWPDLNDISGATYLEWNHGDGLSSHPGMVCTGCHSGYAAINLAVLKFAKTIHLVGYDLDPRENDQYQYWIPRYRDMLPQLEQAGVSVFNHNPKSFIDAFPKVL